jgi:hypothetical protein
MEAANSKTADRRLVCRILRVLIKRVLWNLHIILMRSELSRVSFYQLIVNLDNDTNFAID